MHRWDIMIMEVCKPRDHEIARGEPHACMTSSHDLDTDRGEVNLKVYVNDWRTYQMLATREDWIKKHHPPWRNPYVDYYR